MADLKKGNRSAIEAVAKRFSATWEHGTNPCIAKVKRRVIAQAAAAPPHLRFDKVVIALIGNLQAALAEAVPDGTTVLLTVTAPILVPAKTTAALEDRIRALLGRPARNRDEKLTIHGNHVRINLWKHDSARFPKLIGFVHNPDCDPVLLFHMTRELQELLSAPASGGRWLVIDGAGAHSYLPAYRYIYSQLGMDAGWSKIFMVFHDGRVGVLAE